MKTGIVVGATGLVGSALIKLLVTGKHYHKIIVFSRRPLDIQHEKLQVHIIDFRKTDSWQHLVKGDVLFSTLGTTLKKAGNQQAQFEIDHTWQLNFAKTASLNNVPVYVLVSSASANPNSTIFYTRMKGELEHDVKLLAFKSLYILQPSLLVGQRESRRLGETISEHVLNFVNALGLFKKYKPIPAEIVAQAMVQAADQNLKGIHTYSLNKIFDVARHMSPAS